MSIMMFVLAMAVVSRVSRWVVLLLVASIFLLTMSTDLSRLDTSVKSPQTRESLSLVDNRCGQNLTAGVNALGVCGLVGTDVGTSTGGVCGPVGTDVGTATTGVCGPVGTDAGTTRGGVCGPVGTDVGTTTDGL